MVVDVGADDRIAVLPALLHLIRTGGLAADLACGTCRGRRDAHDLAVSQMASYEGSALLTNTFRDPDILAREARRLDRWIDTL